jgi:hypothetical protein
MRDRDKEYSLVEEKFFAHEKSMHIHKTAPRPLEQNGKVEVTEHYILEIVWAVRIRASLLEFLWLQAITHTVEVQNLTPKRKLA